MENNNQKPEETFDNTYQENSEFFGNPYKELQDYFKNISPKTNVLDLGCGQGRDAIFLSSIGYKVTAVDSSEVGIEQMLEKAKKQDLEIKGIASDVWEVSLNEKFDIILFDMLIHSFEKEEQTKLLEKYASFLNENGRICIVYPDDLSTEYFMDIFNNLSKEWKLKDKIIINDVPKIAGETDFTFEMITVCKS